MATKISFHSLTLSKEIQKSCSVMATTLNDVPGNKVLFYDFFHETRDSIAGPCAISVFEKRTQVFEETVLNLVASFGFDEKVKQIIFLLLQELAAVVPKKTVSFSDIAEYKNKSAEITAVIIGHFFKNRCNAVVIPETPRLILGTKERVKGSVSQSALSENQKYIGAFVKSLLGYFVNTDTLIVPVLLSGTAQIPFLPNTHHLLARLCNEYLELSPVVHGIAVKKQTLVVA